jgi:hypothetical protein
VEPEEPESEPVPTSFSPSRNVAPTVAPIVAPVATHVTSAASQDEVSAVEKEILVKLKEMGFTGDLLQVLRSKHGELLPTIQALLNQ